MAWSDPPDGAKSTSQAKILHCDPKLFVRPAPLLRNGWGKLCPRADDPSLCIARQRGQINAAFCCFHVKGCKYSIYSLLLQWGTLSLGFSESLCGMGWGTPNHPARCFLLYVRLYDLLQELLPYRYYTAPTLPLENVSVDVLEGLYSLTGLLVRK